MENLEKYNNAFVQVFGVNVEELNDDYGKETVEEVVAYKNFVHTSSIKGLPIIH